MDLVDIPAIIANRILKRQPLNIVHMQKHLALSHMQQQRPLPLLLPPVPDEAGADSGPFEDALPVGAFTRESWRIRRTVSDPRHF